MRLFLASLFLLIAQPPVLACSCAGGGGPACYEAWSQNISAVFLGRVVRITGIRDLSVHFDIEDPLMGITGKTVTVQTPRGEAACGYNFETGKRYVVYAHKSSGSLSTGLCTRTRPAEYGQEDIEYFHSLTSLPPTSKIYGSLKEYTFDPDFKPKFQPSLMDHYRPPEEYYRAMVPLPGQDIVLKGPDGERRTSVDKDGQWEISGLVPGDYSISADLPPNTEFAPYRWKVTVAPKGCARVDVRAEASGHISGQIFTGTPAPDWALLEVFVLRREDNKDFDARHPFTYVYVNPNERKFDLGPLPPGHYILGVYLVKKVPVKNGHTLKDTPATFFPGVEQVSGAEIITLGEGTRVNSINVKLVREDLLPESEQ